MKVKRACANVALIGTSLLLLAGIHSSQAAEIKIVLPSAYEDVEGPGEVDSDLRPYRYQQVFPADEFAALGNQPHWLVRSTWRPDKSVTSPLTVELPDVQVRLSTTQRGPDDLSVEFDDNFGSDLKQYYRGPFITVADAYSGPGPRAFYHVEYPAGITPYLYDPSKGNLLWDLIAWQGERPARADRIPGIQTSLYAEPALATQGNPSGAGIFQFTFVPVPQLSNPAWSAGQFEFTLTGETNVNYVIQASTDLQSWTPLATNRSANASRNIAIDAPDSRSFYRAIVGPY